MSNDPQPAKTTTPPPATRPRLLSFTNTIYNESMAGGDVYFYFMIRAAIDAGYPVHFFGGHAMRQFLKRWKLPENLTLTDSGPGKLGDVSKLGGQFRLLWDFMRRFTGSMLRLNQTKPDDIGYVMSDFWFEVIPLSFSNARYKIVHLGMMAPTLKQVIFKQRADVTTIRLPSLYYWLSQQVALRCFRHADGGVVTYCHPEIRDYLLRFGYNESDLWYVPSGTDTSTADIVPAQPKKYDVAWIGRIHPQKGIKDLLETFVYLKNKMPDFRGIIIGKGKDVLEPTIKEMGLADNVTFSGLVSEEEKFRLLKNSRVFAMPSYYESWGIVIAEALAAGVPVVAYNLSCYPDVFGNFLRYVKCFDCDAFKRTVEDEVKKQRAGVNYLDSMDLPALRQRLSWSVAQSHFCDLLDKLSTHYNPKPASSSK